MVSAVAKGESQRSVARRFGVGLSTLQYWISRSAGKRLDRADFSTHGTIAKHIANKTPLAMEQLIIHTRRVLKESGALGEYGAEAIHRHLSARPLPSSKIRGLRLPTVRTINRILERHGLFDGRKRVRRPPPPSGWYLPEVAERRAELDQVDIVEGLRIKDGPNVEVLNIISMHGSLVASKPSDCAISARFVLHTLVEHWRRYGCPGYVSFDNDAVFQAAHQHADVISRVMRMCLSLGVTVVFAPPRRTGFQNIVESYNGRWQQKVWHRFEHRSFDALCRCSEQYVNASLLRHADRIGSAPERHLIPTEWELDLQKQPTGTIIYIRYSNERGQVALLGRRFDVSKEWTNRLVRCTVNLVSGTIQFHALRRSNPTIHALLATVRYELPKRVFRE